MIAACIIKMAHSARRIALIYDARLTYDLKVMTGVAAYLQEGHHYSVFIEENALKDQRLPDLRSWEGDGIIADFDDPAVARLVTQSRLPVVGFGGGYGWYAEGSVPYFYTNNKAIGTLAADPVWRNPGVIMPCRSLVFGLDFFWHPSKR